MTPTSAAKAASLRVRVATQPIAWSNDDFRDLGGDTPLEQCLAEMREAGYEGTELGHKFPREAGALKALLRRFGLSLAGAWHSTYLLSKPFAWEEKALRAHLALLKDAGGPDAGLGGAEGPVAIVAECSGSTYPKPGVPLRFGASDALLPQAWRALAQSLDRLCSLAEAEGLSLAYHPHMGTVIQSEEEVERLLDSTQRLRLVLDSGHLAFAGADPASCAARWTSRIAHVHLKDLRPAVAARARAEGFSFERAVREGAFTVPGDGGVDFDAVLAALARAGYKGWLVVEAEQDPRRANPLDYARRARRYLKERGI